MYPCFFVSDLHGHLDRYDKLLHAVRVEKPRAVLLGGDLLPSALAWAKGADADFLHDWLAVRLGLLSEEMGEEYPRILVILGNDDPRVEEEGVLQIAARGLCEYVHERKVPLGGFDLYGYAYVPPSPYLLKDWERYDVSRYVDVGCVSPEEGMRTVAMSAAEMRFSTIRDDLDRLVGEAALDRAVLLFHAPPYQSKLDRAALDGRSVDGVEMDVHVGSIAIRRFIEARQPAITLHGHVHESARLTGSWRDRIGRTHLFSGAHDGPELALVRFDPERPGEANRELL
ncbi:MAG: metallophosphoesterase [Bradymonadales bacterium]|nr:metallophosphoesterase [Bradymonadales bacterium]